jgi:hypothetical protein
LVAIHLTGEGTAAIVGETAMLINGRRDQKNLTAAHALAQTQTHAWRSWAYQPSWCSKRCAASADDAGFCPVIKRPSCTT